MIGVGPSELQFNLIEYKMRPSTAGLLWRLLGDFLRLGVLGGGAAGRGQLESLFGGRMVGQAFNDLRQVDLGVQALGRVYSICGFYPHRNL